MPRVRGGSNGDPRLTFVEVPTAPLLRMERDDGRSVEGAFVKLAPRLRRSERAAFDAGAARRDLLARGALAVSIAPVLLPDDVARAEHVSGQRVDARHEIRCWFGEQPSEESEQAREGCLVILDQVGL